MREPPASPITGELLEEVLRHYGLDPFGIHGVAHWARVLENGRRLARETGARIEVVELFAVFHDAQRLNDGHDAEHGRRGGELARLLRGSCFDLADEDFELLYEACAGHTDGEVVAHPTVQACWDSDRLDLPRVGIATRRRYLCTEVAKKAAVFEWATGRAWCNHLPDWVRGEWPVDPA